MFKNVTGEDVDLTVGFKPGVITAKHTAIRFFRPGAIQMLTYLCGETPARGSAMDGASARLGMVVSSEETATRDTAHHCTNTTP